MIASDNSVRPGGPLSPKSELVMTASVQDEPRAVKSRGTYAIAELEENSGFLTKPGRMQHFYPSRLIFFLCPVLLLSYCCHFDN